MRGKWEIHVCLCVFECDYEGVEGGSRMYRQPEAELVVALVVVEHDENSVQCWKRFHDGPRRI